MALVCALSSHTICAQQRERKGASSAQSARASIASKERAAQKRRADAVALINETANDARFVDSLPERATIQMLAADALWSADFDGARALFRRAWESATLADKAAQEETAREANASSNEIAAPFPESRDEVLQKAAARDAALAELFLKDLAQDKEHEQSSLAPIKQTRRAPWGELSVNGTRRLALALDLFNKSDYEHAAQIASTLVTEEASADLIAFLLNLRLFKQTAVDAIYLRLIERSQSDATSDVNTVLRLSSLFVSPELMVSIDERGSLQFRSIAYQATDAETLAAVRAPVAPALRDAFYAFAASVLLRPSFAADANQSRETSALFYAINRLLPYIEKDAPQYASALNARSVAIQSGIETNQRDALVEKISLRTLTPERAGDPLRPQTEQLTRARNQTERERASLAITKTAVRNRLWDRARRAANELNDAAVRRAALSFIAVSEVADIARAYTDADEDFQRLAQFVANADLPVFARAWGFAEAAQVAARAGNKERAAELLANSLNDAARVDAATRERIAVYAAIGQIAARIAPERAWDLMPELVRAINGVEDYAGDEASLDLIIPERETNAEETEAEFSVTAEAFRPDKIFAAMARLDFARATLAARELKAKVPRAFAQLACARAVLETRATTRRAL
jgi:hypothetical protein